MTALGRIKVLDPKLYDEALDLQSDIYKLFEQTNKGLAKVRTLMILGKKEKAWKLLEELQKKAQTGV